jgi:hypothetical protein
MRRERRISICIKEETFDHFTMSHATWETERTRHVHINIDEREDSSWSQALRSLNDGQKECEEQ